MEFTFFHGFPKRSFDDGEYGFDFVPLMIPSLVKRPGEFSKIDTGYPLSISRPDRDNRVSVQVITDQSANIF
jgi:hypothetical protein